MKLTNTFQELVLTSNKATVQNTGNSVVELFISATVPATNLNGTGIMLYNKGDSQSFIDIGTGNKLYARAVDNATGYVNYLNFI